MVRLQGFVKTSKHIPSVSVSGSMAWAVFYGTGAPTPGVRYQNRGTEKCGARLHHFFFVAAVLGFTVLERFIRIQPLESGNRHQNRAT